MSIATVFFHKNALFTVFFFHSLKSHHILIECPQLKADLQKDLGFTTSQLGWLDTALLLPYAVMSVSCILYFDPGLHFFLNISFYR